MNEASLASDPFLGESSSSIRDKCRIRAEQLLSRQRFAQSVNDAVTVHQAAIRTLAICLQHESRINGLMRAEGQLIGDISYAEDISLTTSAPVFFFTKQTALAIRTAADSYPIQPPLYMPSLGKCFAVFEEPCLTALIDGVTARFSALCWTNTIRPRRGNALAIDVDGFLWDPPVCTPVWKTSIEHPLESRMPSDPTYFDEQTSILRWILAAAMFIEQRIAIPERASLSRQVRRESERQGYDASKVNVVTLRRLGNVRRGAEINEQEWSCQWLVSGHWRNQWYGKASRHVPRWIAPYVKGPDDKPMKAPNPTVFAVNR